MSKETEKQLEELKRLLQRHRDDSREHLEKKLQPDPEKDERSRQKDERMDALLSELSMLSDNAREMRQMAEESHRKRLADVKKEDVLDAVQQNHKAQVQQIISVVHGEYTRPISST